MQGEGRTAATGALGSGGSQVTSKENAAAPTDRSGPEITPGESSPCKGMEIPGFTKK